MRYREREPRVVDATQFVLADQNHPERPPYPVKLPPCACDAMDAYTCDQHKDPPRYNYIIDGRTRYHWIRPGEWYVRMSDGEVLIFPAEEFEKRYVAV